MKNILRRVKAFESQTIQHNEAAKANKQIKELIETTLLAKSIRRLVGQA